MSLLVNDFHECLKRSHEAHDLPIWGELYRQAFPSMLCMHDHRDNGYWQQAGIDRSITLASSKQLLVDEKIRGVNARTGKVYEDIALEYVSNNRTGAAGWIEKPMAADYIAYVIAPIGKGYLLPVLQLQVAWNERKAEWLARYGFREAPNRGYQTLFCPVPPDVLYPAIGSQLRFDVTPVDWIDGVGVSRTAEEAIDDDI